MEQTSLTKQFPLSQIEIEMDQELLQSGIKPLELEQLKQIARIEENMVSEGHSIKAIYQEWHEKTPDEILRQYKQWLDYSPDASVTPPRIETAWLDVIYLGSEETETRLRLGIKANLRGEILWEGETVVSVDTRVRAKIEKSVLLNQAFRAHLEFTLAVSGKSMRLLAFKV